MRNRSNQLTTYIHDPLNRLTRFDPPGTAVTNYVYDKAGNRTSAGSTETAHYGDLTDLPILDRTATATARSFVAGAPGLIEERSGTATTYPLADAHGDITAVANQSGGVASRNTYDPWGTRLTGNARQMGFLGAQQRRTDPTHGLLQMGVRVYEPGLGRFLSEDPMLGRPRLSQTLNRYSYALGEPLGRYDLDGRCVVEGLGPVSDACDAIGDAVSWGVNGVADVASAGSSGVCDRISSLSIPSYVCSTFDVADAVVPESYQVRYYCSFAAAPYSVALGGAAAFAINETAGFLVGSAADAFFTFGCNLAAGQ